jgi:hypothetical protein
MGDPALPSLAMLEGFAGDRIVATKPGAPDATADAV